MNVNFSKDATSIDIPGFRAPTVRPYRKVQSLDRTAAGGLHVEDLGPEQQTFVLAVRVTTALKDSLYSFYNTNADGALNSFTYTDENAGTHTVLWIDPQFNFQGLEGGTHWDGVITLEKVG